MINPKDAHIKPQPMPDADSQTYWRGIQEGKLLLQHCLCLLYTSDAADE